jgi:hypothetical protein
LNQNGLYCDGNPQDKQSEVARARSEERIISEVYSNWSRENGLKQTDRTHLNRNPKETIFSEAQEKDHEKTKCCLNTNMLLFRIMNMLSKGNYSKKKKSYIKIKNDKLGFSLQKTTNIQE